MRSGTRDRTIRIMAVVLVIGIGYLAPKAAAPSEKYFNDGTCRPIPEGKER